MTENILPLPDLSDTAAAFAPFQWHRDETENVNIPCGAVMRFATEAHDISLGARTILEIIERDGLTEDGERKLFNANDQGTLLRMAITSLTMLGRASERVMDWAYKHHTPEGRAEKLENATAAD